MHTSWLYPVLLSSLAFHSFVPSDIPSFSFFSGDFLYFRVYKLHLSVVDHGDGDDFGLDFEFRRIKWDTENILWGMW